MPRRIPKPTLQPVQPRLWNAKRRIESGRVLAFRFPKGALAEPVQPAQSEAPWKRFVSEDVVRFIEDAKLPWYERDKCIADPNGYFAYPKNVPTALRKQVYFPQFVITLRRTPNLPPRYAAFDVPLWFNKLDMKDYLRSVYGVEVLHVRSFVLQAPVKRRDTKSKFTNGQLYRALSTKKMTVELMDPFVWPEPDKDLSPWEKDTFYKGLAHSIETNKKREEGAATEPNKTHRKSIAEQAKELLKGKQWKPTWESLPTDSRILKPFDPRKLGNIAKLNERTMGRSVSAPR